jgi:thioredoxin reductase (NADPH)
MLAVGRRAATDKLSLESAGVEYDSATGKILSRGGDGDTERTSVDHIYAIGDVLDKGLELTPVAIKAGRFLADRLFGGDKDPPKMDYSLVPTTVFTPLEYGTCGLSEDHALEKFGEDNIEVDILSFRWKNREWFHFL